MKFTDALRVMTGLLMGNWIYAALCSQNYERALGVSYWEFGGVFAAYLMVKMKATR